MDKMNVFLNKVIEVNGQKYKILEHIASGAVGHMFRCRNEEIGDDRAIKFIPKTSVKDGWENEITKAISLRQNANVVKYFTHAECSIENNVYLYIMWDFIENDTLRKMIEKGEVTITLLLDVINTSLRVLHSCKQVGVIHADFHAGNVLIGKPNPLNIDATERKIWITDFSRVTVESKVEYIDDYTGLINIINQSLDALNFHSLDSEDKRKFDVIKNEFIRYLRETDVLIDGSARNPQILITKLQEHLNRSQNRTTDAPKIEINDYLAAEHLGDNFDEWKALFVPKFIAIDELLGKNIGVLTGLRGCGKTMLFKRLSAYFNIRMGGPADLKGCDQFFGFYLNARDIAETFPWLPEEEEANASNQLIHNFNLKWVLEILLWLREFLEGKAYDISFLNDYFKKYFPDYFSVDTGNSIDYLIGMIKKEIGKTRPTSRYYSDKWVLTDYRFLDEFVLLLKEKVAFLEDKPFYFFLDDYSLPMVKSVIQRILNPIIFRRSPTIIFKVSTESVESFTKIGMNGKLLEENDDYLLIDCGSLSLLKSDQERKDILFPIIEQRIDHHKTLGGHNLTIEKLLGETKLNDEERARYIRKEIKEKEIADKETPDKVIADKETTDKEITNKEKISSKYLYQGSDVFCMMWTSDVREMIKLFAEMVSAEENIEKSGYSISDKTQDKIYKKSGGQFMSLLNSITNPSENPQVSGSKDVYARHLVEIVEAFHELASYELKTKRVKNVHQNPIKKARRIEITNVDGDLDEVANDYYRGLIRYGIFVRDHRGKSVRGRIAPRLFLRSRLIPYFRLTFSKHDSISMSWDDFKMFLRTPAEFVTAYKKKREREDTPLFLKECNDE
jgi:serine/threonine protein kinase